MTREAQLLINDINRMSESLMKLIYATDENPDIRHDHKLMLKGIEQIHQGTYKVVESITTR